MPKREIVKRDITRDQFHTLIRKAAQPIEPNEFDSEQLETSVVPQDDGCNGTDIHSNMIEGTSD